MNQNPKMDVEAKKKANIANEAIRYLAFILRHRPHEAKIKLSEGGWAETHLLVEALEKFKKIKMSMEELVALIKAKSKNSFTISDDGLKMKAKSGHTVLLGFTEALRVPNTLCMHMAKNQITAVFTAGIIMKPGEFLTEKPAGATPSGMVLVTINTSKAKVDKTKFYVKDEAFFAFHLPAKCLTFSSF